MLFLVHPTIVIHSLPSTVDLQIRLEVARICSMSVGGLIKRPNQSIRYGQVTTHLAISLLVEAHPMVALSFVLVPVVRVLL